MRLASALLSLAFFAAGLASASTNLVTNGGFESTTNGSNLQLDNKTGRTDRTTLTGWTSSNGNDGGFNFVLDSKIMTTWDSVKWLKGQNNGFANSANGGNVFASDAVYWPGTLSQTVSGLTAGNAYTLSFDYALAQQVGFDGANADNYWHVGFGSATQDSKALSIANGGFSGWQTATMTFTATSASEVLSFLAKGTAPGAPPFLLLDGVSLVSAVPEPTTWAMLLGGLGLVGFAARRRAARQA
ncbi:putative secreted protein with PEP-CTERM sorting signal [Pseudoduganella lurida]|uniref:Putative secreted protein with PEP-CTERM sorting signal n=1 Tax=Pseudoduganella lurida TaxID=1036180 RepID=A0A562R334_9BURK|nr:FxDxF family PEP-CTERM protein [Pseudoduganella lurida]TWI63477.1 putative secreted protein with PEP-CTERM sorting signal [Pseudoduganella lurida]